MKDTNTRLYKIADASLKQLADDLKDSIVRDSADFESYGVNALKIQSLEALINSFNETTTDEELRGMVTTKVEQKNALAENLRQAISGVRNRAKNKYGEDSGKYKGFGFDDLSRLNDDELYRASKRVVRVATLALTDLATEGLTTEILDNITALGASFDKAIDAVGEAEEIRDLETQNRVEKGNALYTEMVKLASTGKTLYEANNPAKYNDYVLIETTAQKEPEAPANPTT